LTSKLPSINQLMIPDLEFEDDLMNRNSFVFLGISSPIHGMIL
jgi:hypothetical protein